MTRGPKKSETLELRIPHGAKQAFMARCAADGRGASETLRALIDGYMQVPARHLSRKAVRILAAAAIVAGAGAVAVPSLAATATRASFDALDADHSGALSLAELSAIDTDHDGRVSYAEFRTAEFRSSPRKRGPSVF